MIKKDGWYQMSPEAIEHKKDASYFDGVTKDTVVYRIFTAERFFQMWDSKKMTFVKPTLWDDPYENIFLHTTADSETGLTIAFNNLVEDLYAQCWTTCAESDALWRIYSPDKTGIMAKTTVGKIVDSFFESLAIDEHFEKEGFSNIFKAGNVDYLDEEQIIELIKNKTSNIARLFQHNEIMETLLYKRKPFEHEQELRFIIHRKNVKANIFPFTIDVQNIFDEIIFDPRMSKENVQCFTDGFRLKGFTKTIRQSSLYYKPTIHVSKEEFNSFFNGKEGQTFTHDEIFGPRK